MTPQSSAESKTAPQREASVRASKRFSELRRRADKNGLFAYDAEMELAYRMGGKDGSSLAAVRSIGSRTFYKRGKEWQEAVYDARKHKKLKTVEIGTKEYFDLLAKDGRLAKFLALGDVVLQIDKIWYRFELKRKKS